MGHNWTYKNLGQMERAVLNKFMTKSHKEPLVLISHCYALTPTTF